LSQEKIGKEVVEVEVEEEEGRTTTGERKPRGGN